MDDQQENASDKIHRKNIKLRMTKNDVQSLLSFIPSMPNEVQVKFTKKYGRLIDLMRINVNESALSALGQYWSPDLRIFELPHLDTCPTIEEYECLLKMKIPCLNMVYHRSDLDDSERKLMNLLKLIPKESDRVDCRGNKGIKRKFLENHLNQLALQKDWEAFMPIYALIIYGLILFPYLVDIIDQAAMEVFYKFEKLGANPVPAILAETFLTLQEWRQTSRGQMKCCSQLLYVWITTHMFADKYMRNAYYPLRNFVSVQIKSESTADWHKEFNEVKPNTYGWRCPWYEGDALVFRCGKFQNVPLIGPRGCVIYTPALVLNQLKFTQPEVSEDKMKGFAFFYQNFGIDSNTLEAFKQAWKDARIYGVNELGKHTITRTSHYESWRKARMKGIVTSVQIPVERKEPQDTIELQKRIEILEAQAKTMENQREDDLNTIEGLQRTVQKRDRSIKIMEEQFLESSHQSKKAKISKNSEDKIQEWRVKWEKQDVILKETMAQKSRLEAEVLGLKREREAMEDQLEALQNDLALSNHHADQGWNTAERCQNSLNKVLKDAEQLSMRVEFLERKTWEQARDIEEQEYWLENWRSVTEDLKLDRNAWKSKYQKLANNLIFFGTTWLGRYEDAFHEVRENLQFNMPPKLDQFFKCCNKMARYLKSWRDDNYLEN